MKYVKTGGVIAVRVDRGEEIVRSLQAVCEQEGVTFASVTGLNIFDI